MGTDLFDILIQWVLPTLGLGVMGPIVARFAAAYRERKNPVSLAIAIAMVAIAALATTPWWIEYLGKYAIETVLILSNLGICAVFWWAVRRERTSFQNTRKGNDKGNDSSSGNNNSNVERKDK